MEFIILTGMSGAGKTIAANTLEDLGYYCVDNMPALMLSEFIRVYKQIPDKNLKVALVVDIRGENEFDTLIAQLKRIRRNKDNCKILFLDCDDEAIVNRHKKTRRSHPLTAMKGIQLVDAIHIERGLLHEVRQIADYYVDTTKLSDQQLRDRVVSLLLNLPKGGLTLTCMSFGFKYGIPSESDMVFDARMLPNPFYVEELTELTGLDAPVKEYIFSHASSREFLAKLIDFTDFLTPLIIQDGRAQAVISIGCTGGKHRSVCLAEALREHLAGIGVSALVMHRDIHK